MKTDNLWMNKAAKLGGLGVALSVSACAASLTPDLQPAHVAPDQGAVFGRVTVFNLGKDVTGLCSVVISGADKESKSVTKADWIFVAVRSGPAYVSVTCYLPTGLNRGGALGPFLNYYEASYKPQELRFDVPGRGQLAYFGHIRVELRSNGPVLGAFRGKDECDNAQAEPQNNLDLALIEYRHRYGAQASTLKPTLSLVGKGLKPASGPQPEIGAGFALGKPVADAEARCTGAGLLWNKLDDDRFGCSGAPVDLGTPVKVGITACAGAVCEVAVNASPDGAAWSALVPRFLKLSERLAQEYGADVQRTSHPLPDCTDGVKLCFDAGRAHTSATWDWPGQRTISLSLDGGPPGGTPELRLVYSTAAQQARQ
jgi:hypothetical protein